MFLTEFLPQHFLPLFILWGGRGGCRSHFELKLGVGVVGDLFIRLRAPLELLVAEVGGVGLWPDSHPCLSPLRVRISHI